MQADPDIEEGIKTSLKVRPVRVKGSKVFANIRDPKIALDDIIPVEIDNPEIIEHMGQKFVKLTTEDIEAIYITIEKFNEIKQWAKEYRKKKEVETNAGNTQDKPGSPVLPTKDNKPHKE